MNGRRLSAHFSPLQAGAVLARFTRASGERLQVHRVRRPRQETATAQLHPQDA